MLKNFTNSILSFLTGIVFTLLIITVGVVVYLFGENSRLRREVEDVRKELSRMELKITTPTVVDDTPPVTGNTQTETYLIPNQIPTRPITGTAPKTDNSSAETEDIAQQPIQQAEYRGTRTYTIEKEVDIQPVTGTKDYLPEEEKKEENSKRTQTQQQETAEPSDNLSESENTESQIISSRPVYDSDAWDNLEENMTKSEVKDLFGKPSQILSRINSTTYVYTYNEGVGNIYFDENGRTTKWQKPED